MVEKFVLFCFGVGECLETNSWDPKMGEMQCMEKERAKLKGLFCIRNERNLMRESEDFFLPQTDRHTK